MGGRPLPPPLLLNITWTVVHFGAANLVSNHSAFDLYLDSTIQISKSCLQKPLTVSQDTNCLH